MSQPIAGIGFCIVVLTLKQTVKSTGVDRH